MTFLLIRAIIFATSLKDLGGSMGVLCLGTSRVTFILSHSDRVFGLRPERSSTRMSEVGKGRLHHLGKWGQGSWDSSQQSASGNPRVWGRSTPRNSDGLLGHKVSGRLNFRGLIMRFPQLVESFGIPNKFLPWQDISDCSWKAVKSYFKDLRNLRGFFY